MTIPAAAPTTKATSSSPVAHANKTDKCTEFSVYTHNAKGPSRAMEPTLEAVLVSDVCDRFPATEVFLLPGMPAELL
jgi:hypothetical protein